jgi:hypothetical protein
MYCTEVMRDGYFGSVEANVFGISSGHLGGHREGSYIWNCERRIVCTIIEKDVLFGII